MTFRSAAVDPARLDSWVAIGGDGRVTIFTGKEEQGTGVATATMQVAADELDVPFDSIDLIISDTWRHGRPGYSSGSQSLITEYGPSGVRQACAEARAALLGMAAAKLNAPIGNLTVSKGVVSVAGISEPVDLIRESGRREKFNLTQTGKATPKPFSAYKVARHLSTPGRDPGHRIRQLHLCPGHPPTGDAPRAGSAPTDPGLEARQASTASRRRAEGLVRVVVQAQLRGGRRRE